MIVPKIVVSFEQGNIQVVDVTPSDNISGSTNYSSGVNNTNYARVDLDSIAFQVIIDKCYKEIVIKPEDVSDVYNITPADLDIEKFGDAVYTVIASFLFDEIATSLIVTEGSPYLTLTSPSDKIELLHNRILLISGQLYEIDYEAVTDADKIKVTTPVGLASGTYSMLHGYRQQESLLVIEQVKSCVMKKIANIKCSCTTKESTEALYMNYKSILANFELGNFGKTIDLVSFAKKVCDDPKIKNCACSC
jgi:hypothetical protein